jgi:hypothetical protein
VKRRWALRVRIEVFPLPEQALLQALFFWPVPEPVLMPRLPERELLPAQWLLPKEQVLPMVQAPAWVWAKEL